jgi:hypothetical protein
MFSFRFAVAKLAAEHSHAGESFAEKRNTMLPPADLLTLLSNFWLAFEKGRGLEIHLNGDPSAVYILLTLVNNLPGETARYITHALHSIFLASQGSS